MEKNITLNTLEGQSSFKTETIRGNLNSVIVETLEKCEVTIESELGYLIMQRKEHKGVIYYAPRLRTSAQLPSLMDLPHFDKFMLNEKLVITVRGMKNQEVKIVLRLD